MKKGCLKMCLIGCAILAFLIVCVLYYGPKGNSVSVEPVESIDFVTDTPNNAIDTLSVVQ